VDGRLDCLSGFYSRPLITRVGTIELRASVLRGLPLHREAARHPDVAQ